MVGPYCVKKHVFVNEKHKLLFILIQSIILLPKYPSGDHRYLKYKNS